MKKFLVISWFVIIAVSIAGFTYDHLTPEPQTTPIVAVIEAPAVEITEKPAVLSAEFYDIANRVNQVRTENGLPLIKLSTPLNASATAKAVDMVERNYWSHDAPDGTTPWSFIDAQNVNYIRAGENLARCYNTTEETVQGWISSPTHYAVMVGDFTDFGFGFSEGSNGCTIVVSHYIKT